MQSDTVPVADVIRRIYENEERDYNVNVLIRRLRRVERTMSGAAREKFAAWVPDGDIGGFADNLKADIKKKFTSVMKILRDENFQKLLVNYPRPAPVFYIAHTVPDEVSSEILFEADGEYLKPPDYLEAFAAYLKQHKTDIEAIRIVLEKPKEWNTSVLKELRNELKKHGYDEPSLRRAVKLVHKKELPDLISIIKNAAKREPLLNVDERVSKAIEKVFSKMKLTPEQQEWLGYIREHQVQNLTIEEDDFDFLPVFEQRGGWSKFKKLFGAESKRILEMINANIAA